MDELPSKKIKDIRGNQFGRLTVLSLSHIADHNGRNAMWTCVCECNKLTVVDSGALRSGSTKSCGCLGAEVSRGLMKQLHIRGKHLYFIRSKQYVKIGRTDDIKKRLVQLNAMNPFGATLIRVLENQGDREKEMHELFKTKHHSGEWFEIDDSEVVNIDG